MSATTRTGGSHVHRHAGNTKTTTRTASNFSPTRLNPMRGGFLLMGVGLVILKWPLLPNAHTLPLFEGVTLCLLTATSLLAFLGLRYPG